uniref:Uncharacterized protein n=1 Tax=Strix occidentalis caurina TaxID=311401 RepID=A0A8D0G1D9_STROC
MALKPCTYPLPETRFLHAGRLVYKFKIRYGNFNRMEKKQSLWINGCFSRTAIRVILGNLDDLHPFSTDHFTIFPYLSKWERVSEMRFKHEGVHLVPYPYICTMYLELNSFQQNLSCGKSHPLSNIPCLDVKTCKGGEFTHFPVHLFLLAGIPLQENMYGSHASEVSWPVFSGGCAPAVLASSVWCPEYRVTQTVLPFLLF